MLYHLPRSPYQVGGSLLPTASTYVERQADRVLLQALLAGHFCYVFNARQTGKSSLRVRTMARLQQMGVQSLAIDLTSIGSRHVDIEQWYAAIADYLVKGFQLSISLRDWWRQHQHLPVVARLAELIDRVLLVQVQQPIVILIDEIDSVLGLKFPTDDFFALIRTCLNRRAEQSDYGRLTFALFGVTTPSALIANKTRTPFNIGQAIALRGFTEGEAEPLVAGLRSHLLNAESGLRRILYWTGGQPFLTQKLCQQMVSEVSQQHSAAIALSDRWIDRWVEQRVLHLWEMQDEPEHLRTIRDRLWYFPRQVSQVLGLYQRILKAQAVGQQPVPFNDSAGQLELLLTGLVEQRHGCLWVKNRIYQAIFNLDWVDQQLSQLRPYAQALQAWTDSHYQDDSRLLRGQALLETLAWAQQQDLSEADYRFLAASQAADRQEAVAKVEAARLREVEARLAVEHDRSLEQQRSLQRQRWLLGGVTFAMMIAAGLGLFAHQQSQQSALNEARAVVQTAEALFASDQKFDALIAAVQGKRHLERQQLFDAEIQAQADNILERVVLSIHQQNRFEGHTASLITVDFSPDGQTLATGGVGGTVKIWQRDGTLLNTLDAHRATTRNVKFSPDGRWLATTGDEGLVKLWTPEGTLVRTLETHQQGIWGLAFSPDSQTLVVAGPTAQLEVWAVTGNRIRLVNTDDQPAGVRDLAYSPQGDRFAVAGNDGTITLWSPTGQRLQTLTGHAEAVRTLAFSPDGELLASGSVDSTIKLWNRQGQLLKTLDHHGATVAGLAFSPDGRTFVSASHDKTLALWNRAGELLDSYRGHQSIVWNVTFSPDGQAIASVSADNSVLLWQPQNSFQQTFKGLPSDHYLKTTYSHDGQTLALGIVSKGLSFLSSTSFEQVTVPANQSSVTNLALHPQREEVISVEENGSLQRWTLEGQRLPLLAAQSEALLGVAWHPAGQELLSSTIQGTLTRWHRDGRQIQQWQGATAPIWDVLYSPDGRYFATATNDGTAQLWTREGDLRHTWQHDSAVWRLAFNPDSTLLATSSGDHTAKVWRLEGSLVSTLEGHSSAVWGIAFSPDGQLIATASLDETVKLWTPAGELLTTLQGHDSGVRSLAFRPDGQVLTSVGDEGSLVHWQLPQILQLEPLPYACAWIADYLKTNPNVEERDRQLCPQERE